MQKLIICRGIMCSGKSTFAQAWVQEDIGYRVQVERDILRKQLYNHEKAGKLSKEREDGITVVQERLIRDYLKFGYSVIVSDTNLSDISRFKDLAKEYNVQFELKVFDTPLEICLERNALRDEVNKIPENVIRKAHKRMKVMKNYKVEKRPLNVSSRNENCIISDLDGTLFYMSGRSPYDSMKCIRDMPNIPVMLVVKAMKEAYNCKFIAVSGREDKAKDVTFNMLKEYGIEPDFLFMRKTGDSRKDSVVKMEIYKEFIEPYFNCLFVLEDRRQVCEVWLQLGLNCFNVRGLDSDF